jgi:hypothetical protein
MSANASPTDLPTEIVELANHAVQFDKDGNLEVAIYYYNEAAKSLSEAKTLGIPFPNLDEQFTAYRKRAEKLKDLRRCYPFLLVSRGGKFF